MCQPSSLACLTSVRFFFFNDTATTEIYTLSPTRRSSDLLESKPRLWLSRCEKLRSAREVTMRDRKSTRLNSSHANISYAVFCLKKKKNYPRQSSAHCADVQSLVALTATRRCECVEHTEVC